MSNQDWNSGINKLAQKLNKLDGTHDVSYDELFNSSFMGRYSQYSTIDEFFDAGGFEFETEEDFEKIPEEQLNAHVLGSTNFSCWKEMLTKAGEDWLRIELGF